MSGIVTASLVCSLGTAADIFVPGSAATIQAAVDIAAEGDSVIVNPGTYPENVVFRGPNIKLRSTDPGNPAIVAATIIDGQSVDTVLKLAGNEQTSTVISGLTIRNGFSATKVGGIYANYTSATIERCRIVDNVGWAGGGISHAFGKVRNSLIHNNRARDGAGLWWCRNGEITDNEITSNTAVASAPFEYNARGGALAYCEGTISGNIISKNLCTGDGGGLYSCSGLILRNEVSSNTAWRDGGGFRACMGPIDRNRICFNSAGSGGPSSMGSGGGIYNSFVITNNLIYGNSAVNGGGGLDNCSQVYNNTIYGNSAAVGGGAYTTTLFRNNIVWNNTAPSGPQVSAMPSPEYCCIAGWSSGGTGNISADPLFINPGANDFHLNLSSPCIDSGGQVSLSADFDGNCRPQRQSSSPGGDGSGYDIGAFEYPGVCSAKGWNLYY